ncbi:MAG: crossover junction endodeoxyribonuclease RuvC [Muribaculaceae bacterium]|nr:crossover junction endodeoxyribonuclease RuvC [Muribaculaceae bacterium]
MITNIKQNNNTTILALDTASRLTGYAIYKDGAIIESGVWRLNTLRKLSDLESRITATLTKYHITEIVAENIYKSQDTRLQSAFDVLSQCQGVLRCISEKTDTPLTLIDPRRAKRAIWGYTTSNPRHKTMPRAEQKERMVRAIQRLGYTLEADRNGNPSNDQADAIGIMLTHLLAKKLPVCHPTPTNGANKAV